MLWHTQSRGPPIHRPPMTTMIMMKVKTKKTLITKTSAQQKTSTVTRVTLKPEDEQRAYL